MNLRIKISLAAFAAISSVAALASAQQVGNCQIEVPFLFDGLGSEAAPNTCELNGASASTFVINENGQVRLVVDLVDPVGDASFADSFGLDINGQTLRDEENDPLLCQAIDADPDAGPGQRGEDDDECETAVRQDLAIEFNEG